MYPAGAHSVFNGMKIKLKNSKSALKRFKISSKGKLQRRYAGIDHFNARNSGNERRQKRQQTFLTGKEGKDIKSLMPYV
jgi:ribosomal protein L35